VASDLVCGEGFDRILGDSDELYVLSKTDTFLFGVQSRWGNAWRNLIKLLSLPILTYRLKVIDKKIAPIFHAHSMFYIFLCWAARVNFIATPMGSDVLVRPKKSRIYRFFTQKSLKAAAAITVDSVAMRNCVKNLCGSESKLVQNGIDSIATQGAREILVGRDRIVSVRGIDPNYRVIEIIEARNALVGRIEMDLIYPFHETRYLNQARSLLQAGDRDYGRVEKDLMYHLFSGARLVVSIPVSDSSPRSVYEAIFCGACVVVSYGEWVESLPQCMRSRVIVANFENETWLEEALVAAEGITKIAYIPSNEALRGFDQTESMRDVCKAFYGQAFDA
jgi:hypothetical protein